MSTAVAVIPVPDATAALAKFRPRVASYVQQSRASSTMRGYRSDWRHFCRWCADENVTPMPADPEAVAAFLTHCADIALKAGSIQRRVAAIAAFHTAAGYPSPTADTIVKLTLGGIRRAIGVMQVGKTPTLTADIAAMLATLEPKGVKAIRDRAIILLGYAGAFRRSELVALDVEDIEFTADGIRVLVRKSKTDQEAQGQRIGIAHGSSLCPVKALRKWLEASGIASGAIFRGVNRHGSVQPGRLTAQVVATVVQDCAKACGLDPKLYAGHSLRAGLVTQAALNGQPEHAIMRQTRHKSSDMLRKYIRVATLFSDNVSGKLGL